MVGATAATRQNHFFLVCEVTPKKGNFMVFNEGNTVSSKEDIYFRLVNRSNMICKYQSKTHMVKFVLVHSYFFHVHTVDGRNPAPVDMENISLFTGFYTFQVVVWDVFHQH